MKYPSHELVATLWLDTLGLTADDIGSSLPGDPTLWATGGYVQATTVGGQPAIHVPMFAPLVQVDCWASAPDSRQAPWGKAGDLAGQVVAATYAFTKPVDLVMPSDYEAVRVHSVYPVTEPRRIPGDDAGYARVNVDVIMRWSWVS